jgi:hypothetical protein
MEIIMNTEQNHPQQPILKQSFRVPQLLYVKIEDRIHSSKVLMPWSTIFDFSTSCAFTELYNSIKNGQSAPDGWTFPEKYIYTIFYFNIQQLWYPE